MPLTPESVTVMDHELTPARSSAIPRVIGSVARTADALAAGVADPAISRGDTGALTVLVNEARLLFRSRTLPEIVMGFSMPKSKIIEGSISIA